LILTVLPDATPGQRPFRTPPIEWDLTDAHGALVPHGDYRVYMRVGDIFLSSSDVTIP